MKIRRATIADRERIVAFITPILGEHRIAFDARVADADLNDLQKSYDAGGGWFHLLVTDGDQIVGTIGFMPQEPGVGKIRKMYVAKELRGTGLGKQLLDETLSKAKALGFRTIVLETIAEMKQAVGFYRHLGFREIARKPVSPRCDLVFGMDLA